MTGHSEYTATFTDSGVLLRLPQGEIEISEEAAWRVQESLFDVLSRKNLERQAEREPTIEQKKRHKDLWGRLLWLKTIVAVKKNSKVYHCLVHGKDDITWCGISADLNYVKTTVADLGSEQCCKRCCAISAVRYEDQIFQGGAYDYPYSRMYEEEYPSREEFQAEIEQMEAEIARLTESEEQ